MATRLLEDKTRMADHRQTLAKLPWISSGWLSDNALIKGAPGYLGGVLIRNVYSQTNSSLRIWDSGTAAGGAGYVELVRVHLKSLANDLIWVRFPLPGVEARFGIYVVVTKGDWVEYEVYYK